MYRYPISAGSLRESISKHGLIDPILFVKLDSRLVLYDGARRVLSLIEMGFKEARFLIVEGENPRELFLKKLARDSSLRELNVVERALALGGFISIGGKKEDFPFERVEELLFIYELPQWKKELFFKWRLTEAAVPILKEFGDADILGVLKGFNLNFKQFKEITSMVKEVARREGVALSDVLKELETEKGFESFRRKLFKMRYPIFSRALDRLNAELSRLPRFLRVHPPPFLEGNRWRFEGEFSSKDELDKIIDGLKILGEIIKDRRWLYGAEGEDNSKKG